MVLVTVISLAIFYGLVATAIAAYLNKDVASVIRREDNVMVAVLWPIALPFYVIYIIAVYPFYRLYLWLIKKDFSRF